MTQPTPGPWRVARADEAPEHGLIVVDKEGGSIGYFMPAGPWMSIEEARANCRLAALSHEMFEILVKLVDPDSFDQHPQDFNPDWRQAREMISRAQGFKE